MARASSRWFGGDIVLRPRGKLWRRLAHTLLMLRRQRRAWHRPCRDFLAVITKPGDNMPSDRPASPEDIERLYRQLCRGLGHELVTDDNVQALIVRAEQDGH